jgi:hypothetical protein
MHNASGITFKFCEILRFHQKENFREKLKILTKFRENYPIFAKIQKCKNAIQKLQKWYTMNMLF